MKIKLIHTQKALSPTPLTLAKYTINPYRGCEFGCKYCYAQYNQNREKNILGVKINLPQVLGKELKYKKIDKVVLGGSCECFTWSELKYKITYKVLEILNKHNVNYIILTKSSLINEYLSLIQKNNCEIFFTFNFTQEKIKRILEENSPSLNSRLKTIKKIKERKIPFRLHIGPFIPYITDLEEIFSLFENIAYKINIELYHHHLGNFNQVIESLKKSKVFKEEKIEKLISVYSCKENFYNFAQKLKEEILKKAKKYNFKIFYIVPGWQIYYTQDINYEKPLL